MIVMMMMIMIMIMMIIIITVYNNYNNYNTHKINYITTGLYPSIVRVLRPPKRYIEMSGKCSVVVVVV